MGATTLDALLNDLLARIDQEVGELREAKGLLLVHAVRRAVRDFPIAVLVANDDGRYVAASEGAAQLTGYTISELQRLSVWDLTAEVERLQIEPLWREFIRHGVQSGDYVLRRQDGTDVAVTYTARSRVAPGLHISVLAARAKLVQSSR